MTDNVSWRKSSYSGAQGGNCVEVGQSADGSMLVRDTKDHGHGPVHRYTPAEWRGFIASVRKGAFDLGESGQLSM
ncbi:MAG: DUF397 domain-containing protein [Pseudonocardiales bacterium]|nr:DUF397 domain-containing protein [Pseudonocardiales bacterium]